MRTRLLVAVLLCAACRMNPLVAQPQPQPQAQAQALPTVYYREAQVPVLLDAPDNTILQFRITSSTGSDVLNALELQFDGLTDLDQIEHVAFYYMGVEAPRYNGAPRFSPIGTLTPPPSYSLLLAQETPSGAGLTFNVDKPLFNGVNYFRIGLKMRPEATLHAKVGLKVAAVTLNDQCAPLESASPAGIVHRMGLAVRNAGVDGVTAYRIPGLTTTNNGTLLAVYDVRYNSSKDLQEYVEIGLSRSTNGGRTWEPMRFPLAFGQWGGFPKAQNGVGDPAILVDTQTNTAWVIAWWTHAMGNAACWNNSRPGLEVETTGQLVLSKSADDGQTWSEPINITAMVKRPEWPLLLQGPGRGITLEDGTLVFPIQFKDTEEIPHSGIMYSKDHGETWTITSGARSNTTEAQVAQLPGGELMLNMRDNRGGSRAVATTSDLGITWQEHPSSRSALPESVCMASLISVRAADNCTGRDLLLFSNPNTTQGRHHTTIKVSLDNGLTWPQECQVMLDEGENWGYSCLTLIDRETIGILYESSQAHMMFQAVKLADLVKQTK